MHTNWYLNVPARDPRSFCFLGQNWYSSTEQWDERTTGWSYSTSTLNTIYFRGRARTPRACFDLARMSHRLNCTPLITVSALLLQLVLATLLSNSVQLNMIFVQFLSENDVDSTNKERSRYMIPLSVEGSVETWRGEHIKWDASQRRSTIQSTAREAKCTPNPSRNRTHLNVQPALCIYMIYDDQVSAGKTHSKIK